MYIRYICTFHMCMQHGIGNATTAIQGFPSLWITSTRVTCFLVHNASVLPMHGFDLAKHVNHNEGGWTDEPLGQDRLLRPHCPQPGSCKLVRCIEFKNVFLRTTRPWGVLHFTCYGRTIEIMLTVLGFDSYRFFFNWDNRIPIHTLHHRCHGTYIPRAFPTNTYNNRVQQIPITYFLVWNTQGARLMSMFYTIQSLRKTSLRRDWIV